MKRYLKGFKLDGILLEYDDYQLHFDAKKNGVVGENMVLTELDIMLSSSEKYNDIFIMPLPHGQWDEVRVLFNPNESIGVVRRKIEEVIRETPNYEKFLIKVKLKEFLAP